MVTIIVDEYGNYNHADDLNAPNHGFCPRCRARMYRKILRGIAFYCLFPHEEHLHKECRQLDHNKLMPSLSSDTPDLVFIHHFASNGKRIPVVHKGGTRASHPIVGRACDVKTLSQLSSLGLLNCKDKLMPGGWRLCELTINPQYSHMLLGGPDIGGRILQGKPQYHFDASRTIRMKVFIATDARGRRINKYITTDLRFAEEVIYRKAKDRLFRKGKGIYSRVAVVGDWVRVDKQDCRQYCTWYCDGHGWSCDGYYYANIGGDNWIYPIEIKSEEE